jgi:hypothetical protein
VVILLHFMFACLSRNIYYSPERLLKVYIVLLHCFVFAYCLVLLFISLLEVY